MGHGQLGPRCLCWDGVPCCHWCSTSTQWMDQGKSHVGHRLIVFAAYNVCAYVGALTYHKQLRTSSPSELQPQSQSLPCACSQCTQLTGCWQFLRRLPLRAAVVISTDPLTTGLIVPTKLQLLQPRSCCVAPNAGGGHLVCQAHDTKGEVSQGLESWYRRGYNHHYHGITQQILSRLSHDAVSSSCCRCLSVCLSDTVYVRI